MSDHQDQDEQQSAPKERAARNRLSESQEAIRRSHELIDESRKLMAAYHRLRGNLFALGDTGLHKELSAGSGSCARSPSLPTFAGGDFRRQVQQAEGKPKR